MKRKQSPPPLMRLECRYSSAEILILELNKDEITFYFDHSPRRRDRWSLPDFLSGKYDGDVANLYPREELDLFKERIRAVLESAL